MSGERHRDEYKRETGKDAPVPHVAGQHHVNDKAWEPHSIDFVEKPLHGIDYAKGPDKSVITINVVGQAICCFKHDGMHFFYSKESVNEEINGFYFDHQDKLRKILKESMYGEYIIKHSRGEWPK